MNYISIHLYRKMIHHALEEGMTEEDFKDLQIGINDMEEIQAVPADHFFALHEKIDKINPGFAIRVGQAMQMEDYGVLGLSWRTCSRVGQIFERCERYFHLLSNTYVFKVETEGNISKVYLFRDAYRKGVALSNEATFSATVVVLKAMTEKDIVPTLISFKHQAPQDLENHQEAFQCPIQFNQAHNFIAYHTADLETRTAKADRSIHQYLLERVAEEQKGIEVNANKIALDVQKLIKDALPSGIPSIAELGDHLGMSTRTLTRRLSENGLTFREIIQKTQQEISIDLLKNSAISVGEIAFLTGFSEQSAFNRAFKRWIGKSPVEFRKTS